MAVIQSLVDTCIHAIARHMPGVNFNCASVPEPQLAQRIYGEYARLDRGRRLSGRHSPAAHLTALRQFTTCWQPAVLYLQMQQTPGPAFAELAAFSSCLVHLELACDASTSQQLPGLASLTALSCLSLRGCMGLQESALWQLLQGLTQLRALDLCGLQAVSDSLAPALASLQQLHMLNLNRTQCTDATVDWLTYGHRLVAWQQAAQEQQMKQQQRRLGVPAPVQEPVEQQLHGINSQQWPRCKIRQWHLANTRITARTAELLWSLPELIFLDMRGSGVAASQLVPLKTKFSLGSPQGAVLSRSAAMTLAAVTLDRFVCCQPAEHSAAVGSTQHSGVAGSRTANGSGYHASEGGAYAAETLQQWVQQGVEQLIHARAEVDQQQAAEAQHRMTGALQQLGPINQAMHQPVFQGFDGRSQARAGDYSWQPSLYPWCNASDCDQQLMGYPAAPGYCNVWSPRPPNI